MNISLIGSGNVATHLASALHGAGHNILQIWSREYDHAARLAEKVCADPIDKLSLLYPTAEVYILAVSDDALFDLAMDLRLRDALVLHTSGSTPLDVLRPISRKCGVIWSPQTFTTGCSMNYAELPFCIEGSSPQVEEHVEALLRSFSQHIYRLDSSQRGYLHLTAVLTNNFCNALNATAQVLLMGQAIPFEILHTIIRTTAEKALSADSKNSTGLWQQQTGPAVRHDDRTLLRHRQLLLDDPDLLHLYETLTAWIQKKKKQPCN